MESSILEIRELHIFYDLRSGPLRAVNGLSFSVYQDEVFGLAGESGCGKSTLAMGILQLLQAPAKIEKGQILFNGDDLTACDEKSMRLRRWKDIAYIPQGAMSSLNPVIKICSQFRDVLVDHTGRISRDEFDRTVLPLLEDVNLKADVLDKYPHELSGGMKQRICIAMSMLLSPGLIIADEPTSALDVISQRTVLEKLSEAREKMHASMILIGHDMALQAQIADRLGIMYAGRMMEIGTVDDIFNHPQHPYTRRLISSIPSISKKQEIRKLALDSFSEQDKLRFQQSTSMTEFSPGHYVAEVQ
jgi:peptide/nickel transport system ATP-binding protein